MIILRKQKEFGLFSKFFKPSTPSNLGNEEWIKREMPEEEQERIDHDFLKFLHILDTEINKLSPKDKKNLNDSYDLPFVTLEEDYWLTGPNSEWFKVIGWGEDPKEQNLYYCPDDGEWIYWDTSRNKTHKPKKKFKEILLPMLGDWYYSTKSLYEYYKEDGEEDSEDGVICKLAMQFLGKLIGICKREFKITR